MFNEKLEAVKGELLLSVTKDIILPMIDYHYNKPPPIPTTKQVLIDQINAGVRDALMALSDLLREEGDEGAADCFLWCWKMNRWPHVLLDMVEPRFQSATIQPDIPSDGGQCIGNHSLWGGMYASEETVSPTIFGAFSNFLEKMWRKSPDHVAKLMEDL